MADGGLKAGLVRALAGFAELLDRARNSRLAAKQARARAKLQSIGDNVHIDVSAEIIDPQAVAVGNNVQIGPGVYIQAQGGLQIQDNVHISNGVAIYTCEPSLGSDASLPDKQNWRQVVIERNVCIGRNAVILPGVTIGEGAIVGPGATIGANVPPRAVMSAQPAVVTGERSADAYEDIKARQPAATSRFKRGDERTPNICFVLTTGRAGSTTIAAVLNQHPKVDAKHEAHLQLVKWSTDYAHGALSHDDMKRKLVQLLLQTSVYRDDTVYVFSDLKLFNLTPLLREIIPSAKFVWMLRSGSAVVASTVGRSWYAGPDHPVWKNIDWYYHDNRIRGDLCGSVTAAEWASMTPFEKNCWYWTHVNTVIERDLNLVPESLRRTQRLEDFDAAAALALQRFLNVEPAKIPVTAANEAHYDKHGAAAWTEQEVASFDRICGPLMRRLYPNEPGQSAT
jgi:acetyltransferase-like isoleucine patch superfamily enzyme